MLRADVFHVWLSHLLDIIDTSFSKYDLADCTWTEFNTCPKRRISGCYFVVD